MWIDPRTWYRQLSHLLKPFYKLQGPEFLIELEKELNNLGLQKYGETVKLARKHLEQEIEGEA